MGKTFSTVKYFDHYRLVKSVENSIFGFMWVFQNIKDHKMLYVQDIHLPGGNPQALKLMKEYEFKHPNLLKVEGCISLNGAEMNHLINVWKYEPKETITLLILQYFETNLLTKLAEQKFTEEKLWKLAGKLLSAMQFLQKKNLLIGKLSIESILLTPENKPLISHIAAYVQAQTPIKKDFQANSFDIGEILLFSTTGLFQWETHAQYFKKAKQLGFSEKWIQFLRDLVEPKQWRRMTPLEIDLKWKLSEKEFKSQSQIIIKEKQVVNEVKQVEIQQVNRGIKVDKMEQLGKTSVQSGLNIDQAKVVQEPIQNKQSLLILNSKKNLVPVQYELPNKQIVTIPAGINLKDHKLYFPLPPDPEFIKIQLACSQNRMDFIGYCPDYQVNNIDDY